MAEILRKEIRRFVEKLPTPISLSSGDTIEYFQHIYEDSFNKTTNELVTSRQIQKPEALFNFDKTALIEKFSIEKETAQAKEATKLNELINQIQSDIVVTPGDVALPTPTPEQIVAGKVAQLRKAVTLIQDEFIKENILLGIEQRGLTEQVLTVSGPVMLALQGLAIKVAVTRLKEIDPASFDGVILNADRLLKFRNKMEDALGVPRATEWNSPPTW